MRWLKDKKRMDFIQSYRPTSKAQLLQVALWYHKGDTDKAQQMFDYYTKNIQLPDTDPVPPTLIQQAREGAGGLWSWIKENQGDLAQGYEFIRSIIQNKGALPPLGIADTSAEEPLPPINE